MKRYGKPITILVADDNTLDCLFIKEALETSHLLNDLRFVQDGVELMEYLRRKGRFVKASDAPRPGLILLDLNMPRKDGRQALREIQEDPSLREIPVVVLTASKAEEDFHRAHYLGVRWYLNKPVTFDGLVLIVKALGLFWFEILGPVPTAPSSPLAAEAGSIPLKTTA